MTEHDDEPVRGLPGRLPPGERILWQGTPDTALLARTAFHTRSVGIYFAALTVLAIGVTLLRGGSATGVLGTVACGIAAVALLRLLAWAAARATVYTLTDKRIVLRVGVAVSKCVNLPLSRVAGVDLANHADGAGDIAVRLSSPAPLGWVALWPHARPWRIARPEPMLRGVPDAATVAALIARACTVAQTDAPPAARPVAVRQPEAVAA